mmetsp:Transcript_14959/g.47613  ORF Transcript_14959/g.47613 Transcript_14959/m.47613 type:complete len:352 (+) Transcript_14959:270-1325(+)
MHRILIERNAHSLCQFLQLGACQSKRPQIPQHQMVVGSPRNNGIPPVHQRRRQRLGVGLDGADVSGEGGLLRLAESHGEGGDLVVVGAALQAGEDCEVDVGLEPLPVEDDTGAGAAQRLVGGGGDDVAMGEGVVALPRGHQPRDVRHVVEQEGPDRVRDLSHAGIIPVAGVGGGSGDDELGTEEGCAGSKGVVVDQAGSGRHLVWQRLKIDRGGRHAPLVGVIPVRQMPPRRQVQPHHSVVRLQQRRVGGKVGGRARVWLDVHTPLVRIQAEEVQRTRLAQPFQLVDVLVAAVITCAGKTLRVLVCEDGAERLPHLSRDEVLTRNQLEPVALPLRLRLDQSKHLWVGGGKR